MALGTLTVDVSFSVAPLIAAESEEVTKPLIFRAALCDISRKASEQAPDDDSRGENEVRDIYPRIRIYHQHYIIDDKEGEIHPQKSFVECIVAVSSVHKSVNCVFYFSHFKPRLFGSECFYGVLLRGKSRRDKSRDEGEKHTYDDKGNTSRERKRGGEGGYSRKVSDDSVYREAKEDS